MTHSIIIYSKHCITEYNEGILLDQEGYRKSWQGIDHKVDEEGGKNQIPSGREIWGRGIWATTRMLTVVMMVTNWVCVQKDREQLLVQDHMSGGGVRPRDGRVRKEVCVC